jgi:hypothetical protein
VSLASSQDGSITGRCPTACAITSREGEAGYPVTVASLPARGRPPQAAARRAGLEDVVEKVLTTSILKANRTAMRAVKRQGIVAP